MALLDDAVEAQITIDRNTCTITMFRTFAAERERVFEAWTLPEHIRCWWDPSGVPLADCKVDLRSGGGFKFVSGGSHGAPSFEGVYREIVAPERLEFEAMGSLGSVLLKEAGDRTSMTVTIKCGSPEQLELFLKLGVDVGTSQTLDNLVAYLASERR